MNRSWMTLVAIGVIAVIVIVGWDVVLTITGNKSTFNYNIVPMSNTLFGNLETHLKADPQFSVYEQEAKLQVQTPAGNTNTTPNLPTSFPVVTP